MNYIVLICAREGSKGLPGKNIRPLNGIPLIGWAINSAKKINRASQIIVSTDSEEIALLASNPKFLSQSGQNNSKYIQHMSHVSMQEIARNKVAMEQLVSLKDIEASQLFDLLKTNSLIPALVLIKFGWMNPGSFGPIPLI